MASENKDFENEITRDASLGNADLDDEKSLEIESTQWPGLEPEQTVDQDSATSGAIQRSYFADPQNWPNIDGYVIEQYLGGGGFGDVFKAKSIKLGGPVAIKILKPQFSSNETVTKRFQQEVHAAALTRNTHVVQVLDSDISIEPPYHNSCYLVTEYLAGGDFSSWLQTHSPPDHLEATIRILIGVCRGLEAIHRNGIVHRDVKPENILIDADGVPKVGDFGLSVLDLESDIRMTRSNQIFGTLPFMAPEQILSARDVVSASDQYSVGVMLYVILCRLRPWQEIPSDDMERSRILSNLKSLPPAPIEKYRRVDSRLQEICLRCLQPLPEDRYPSVMDLRLALDSWLHKDAQLEPQIPKPWINPGTIGIGGAILTAFVLLVAVLPWANHYGSKPTGVGQKFALKSNVPQSGNHGRSTRGRVSDAKDGGLATTLPLTGSEDKQAKTDSTKKDSNDTYARDRAAIEWLYSIGGAAMKAGGQTKSTYSSISEIEAIETQLPLRAIKLPEKTPINSGELKHLSGLPGLSYVSAFNSSIDSDALRYITESPNIQVIDLMSTQLKDEDLSHLSRLRHLASLYIESRQIENWEFLSHVPQLRYLRVRGAGAPSFKEFPKTKLAGMYFGAGCSEEDGRLAQEKNPSMAIWARTTAGIVNRGQDVKYPATKRLREQSIELQEAYGKGPIIGADFPSGLSLNANLLADLSTSIEAYAHHLRFRSAEVSILPEFLQGRILENVDLNHTALDDETFLRIARICLVKRLSVSGTRVTEDAVERFRRMQPTCHLESDYGIFPYQHQLPSVSDFRPSGNEP